MFVRIVSDNILIGGKSARILIVVSRFIISLISDKITFNLNTALIEVNLNAIDGLWSL